ncbi:MAG: hypothetical protein HOO96_06045 [Polyangiaceae bacterium]|nr:hypothetical protein [Polyangiaceae bacterium]
MQNTPNKETALMAMAKFLGRDVRPLVKDARVQFRILVAESLLMGCAGELAFEDEHLRGELERLFDLVGEAPVLPVSGAEKKSAVGRMTSSLRNAVKTADADTLKRLQAHVKATLHDEISVANPRFSFAEEI